MSRNQTILSVENARPQVHTTGKGKNARVAHNPYAWVANAPLFNENSKAEQYVRGPGQHKQDLFGNPHENVHTRGMDNISKQAKEQIRRVDYRDYTGALRPAWWEVDTSILTKDHHYQVKNFPNIEFSDLATYGPVPVVNAILEATGLLNKGVRCVDATRDNIIILRAPAHFSFDLGQEIFPVAIVMDRHTLFTAGGNELIVNGMKAYNKAMRHCETEVAETARQRRHFLLSGVPSGFLSAKHVGTCYTN